LCEREHSIFFHLLERRQRFRQHLAAVDDERLASYVRGFVRGKERAAYAMSSTDPRRFMAVILPRYSAPIPSMPSVFILPGITALIVMLYGASSIAAVCMKPSGPALLAPVCAPKNGLVPQRQAGAIFDAAEALGDRGVLQQKRLGPPTVQAERDCRAVVAGGVGALTQRLTGRAEIVVASRIQRIDGHGLGQCLGGEPVIAGCLIQQAMMFNAVG
jgi:hypothetical protein